MNILIVGNGFDLSHYLPTKYDHFMDVMKAIEKKDLGQSIANVFKNSVEDFPTLLVKFFEIKNALDEKSYEMSFDELFSQSREKWFIDKTKSMYSTNEIKLSFQQIFELQYKLKNNGWYQYFKNHVEEIKTWIDFEQKIEEILFKYSKVVIKNVEINNNGTAYDLYNFIEENKKLLKSLNYFRFTSLNMVEKVSFTNNSNFSTFLIPKKEVKSEYGINSKFCYGENPINGFSSDLFLTHLNNQLEDFIEIFNLYLGLVISRLLPIESFSIDSEDWICPNKIFSFNYTNTYQRIHDSVEVEYLHGSHGEEQNIVLGVSDLEDESLKKIKAYGFTKYHQKLFKDTDYLFLDEHKRQILLNRKKMLDLNEQLKGENRGAYRNSLNQQIQESEIRLNLNFYIWGHSLDVSDKDYILDLFNLNDDIDRNVRVTVYYFNKTAKFDLLNNLLAILGKDKVEHWMKNKWLQFKENPKIVPKVL